MNLDDVPGNDVDFYLGPGPGGVPRLFLLLEKIEHAWPGQFPSRTPFNTAVQLTGRLYMPPTRVTAAMDFTPAPGAVAGSSNKVKLTADGVHIPTFSGFTQDTQGAGQGWTNTAGVQHIAHFAYDGVSCTYTLYPM